MNTRQGSVAIYIVLLMLLMMTSTAVVLSGVLIRHIRSANNYLKTEQAFSAANDGIEQLLYKIYKEVDPGERVTISGEVLYNDGAKATFTGCGSGETGDNGKIFARMASTGKVGDVVRRIQIGGGDTECEDE